ncbi:RNA-binding protein MEX3B [Anguilla rostrata]|uniref:RNA-binding protein MEX3B n=1 Tax=Anguilla rostrata TaxID=7938 RepID=UPI0030CE6438
MPSSTSLLEAEETESELPPLVVETFAGIGLDDHGTQCHTEPQEPLLHTRPASHFSLLGTVLDLQPLPLRKLPAEEDDLEEADEAVVEEADSNTLLAQAPVPGLGSVMLPGMEAAETVILYGGGLDDHTQQQVAGMMILPPVYGEPGFEVEHPALVRRKSVNTTECVAVPSSEHVAEIVGRQGCKIKALRAKTNTYIKTPVRGEQPVFVVTGRKEDVAMAKREILSAAEHFSLIRASRNKAGPLAGAGPGLPGTPTLAGQTTIQVRVPYRVVGLVVGPKGATIKRIQQQTHTYIVTPSRDKEPVFEVTGMPENVDRAREEIEAHIALRTGGCVEAAPDGDDFHYNGTDVSFEAGGPGPWPGAGGAATAAPANGCARMTSSYRNDSSSSLGSGSSDSYYGGGRAADYAPASPFNGNSNNNNNGGGSSGFWFGETLLPVGPDDMPPLEPTGLESLGVTAALPGPHQQQALWSPFEQGAPLFEGRGHAPRHDSQPGTPPRLSPTFPEGAEHPAARRVHSEPLSAQPPRFPPCGPAFSSSGDSTASGSPPDSAGSAGGYRARQDCIRCLESDIIAALVPCGHNLFCMECANRICQKPEPLCPVCQAPVTQAIRLRNI